MGRSTTAIRTSFRGSGAKTDMTTAARPIVFTDLDDTMFSRKGDVPPEAALGCIPVVTDTGNNVSVMTAKQRSLFHWISATSEVIPITARSYEAFLRIDLNFGDGWKIVGNGAVVIRPGGELDLEWAETIRSELATFGPQLIRAHDIAVNWLNLVEMTVETKRYYAHGAEHCVMFTHADPRDERLAELAHKLQGKIDGIHVHQNGATIAFTACPVSKRRAAEYVLSQIPDIANRIVFGLGDSLSDIPFMAAMDFMCAPADSQIARKIIL